MGRSSLFSYASALVARGSLGDLAVVVLTGAKTFTGNDIEQTEWRAMHPELAALSSRGAHRLVNCGHGLPFAAPDAVIEAIECVATAAATG